MNPEIVERPKLLLAGIVGCGKSVSDIDIYGLWNVYAQSEPSIRKRIDGSWYELHVGSSQGNGIYSVMAGAEVTEAEELPVEISLKVLPAGMYAHFLHCMKNGTYSNAFAKIDAWVKKSGAKVKDFGLQIYDRDFEHGNESSILHIYIPIDQRICQQTHSPKIGIHHDYK